MQRDIELASGSKNPTPAVKETKPKNTDKPKPKADTEKKPEANLSPLRTGDDKDTKLKGDIEAAKGKPISVDNAKEMGRLDKVKADLDFLDGSIKKVNSIADNFQAYADKIMTGLVMSPEELAIIKQDPEMAEYAGEMYEVEKMKYDATQGMVRNAMMSLISQVFSGFGAPPGSAATTGTDVYTAGAQEIQRRQDTVAYINKAIDKQNQEFAAKHNLNMLEWAKDYNANAATVTKARNDAIFKSHDNRVKAIRAILTSVGGVREKQIDGQEGLNKTKADNKVKIVVANSDQLMAVLDANAKIRVANLKKDVKIKIANQVNDVALFNASLRASELDDNKKTRSMMKFPNMYKDAGDIYNAIEVDGITTLSAMQDMDEKTMSEFGNTYGESHRGFVSALESRMTNSLFFDPNVRKSAFTVGRDWNVDGRPFVALSQKLANAGYSVTPKAWKQLNLLTNEELDEAYIDPDTRDLKAKGKLGRVLEVLRNGGSIDEGGEKFSGGDVMKANYSRQQRNTLAAGWLITTGASIKNMMTKTDTQGREDLTDGK